MSPTPILDRQEPVPAAVRQRMWPYYLLGAILGVAIMFVPDRIQQTLSGLSAYTVLGVAVALCLGVLLHEVGHLVAGLALGFEFRAILSGPLMLSKESRGYRFRFLPARILGGGFTAMVPPSPDDLRRRFSLFVAGGPIATGLLFLPVVFLPWGSATASLLVANGLLALSCWIPKITKGQPSDAKILQLLAQYGPSSERLVAILYLISVDSRGVLPKDWPRELVDKLTIETADTAYYAAGRLYRYLAVRDGGTRAEAAAALEQLLDASGELRPELRRAYFAEAAFFQGAVAGNAALAAAWLEDARKIKQAIREPNWDASALAAIALANGNQAEVREHLARAVAFLDRHPGKSGSIAAARAQLLAFADGPMRAS